MGNKVKHMMSESIWLKCAKLGVLISWFVVGGCGSDTKNESGTPSERLKQEKAKQAKATATESSAGKTSKAAAGQSNAGGAGVDNQTPVTSASPEAPEPTEKPAPIPAGEVDNALMLVRKGQYEQAIGQAKAALRQNEKYVPAMVVMSRAYYQLNKLEFAEAICDIALSIDPTSGECLNLKGFVALKNENDPLAREQFEKATNAKPNFGPAWLNLGAQYLKVKNYSAAITALEKAVSNMPNRPEAYLNLGSAYRGAGELAKAQQSYEQALKLQPNFPSAYFNLGILFLDAATFPGMTKLQQLNVAVENFSKYKRQMTYLSKDDPVDSYIKEAQKSYEREQKQLLRDAQRKAREAAKKAAPPPAAPAAAPAPAAGAAPASAAPAKTGGSEAKPNKATTPTKK